jgi:DNA polymerase III sliding clamp (beta) subunit (PCNA family)
MIDGLSVTVDGRKGSLAGKPFDVADSVVHIARRDVQSKGLNAPIGINAGYLLDALRAMTAGSVEIGIEDPCAPLMFREIGSGNWDLIMPGRIS